MTDPVTKPSADTSAMEAARRIVGEEPRPGIGAFFTVEYSDAVTVARAYLNAVEALEGARSQMHNLPRSLSAEAAVSIIDAALEGK